MRPLFTADAKTLSRIEPTVRRVIVADPNMASARLLADIMKSLGARDVVVESDEARVLEVARELEPGLLFIERTGPRLDGENLARRVRRSLLACRQLPIIMVTAEATATSIKGARDAGVHEFLRKPFTAADLFKRVENVALKSRNWIEGVGYVGPDRRRFNSGEYAGPQKRRADKPASVSAARAQTKDQAMRILAAALAQFDADPMQATRAVRQQAETLRALAVHAGDAPLAIASAGLEAYLAEGPTTRTGLAAPVAAILALNTPEPLARAG